MSLLQERMYREFLKDKIISKFIMTNMIQARGVYQELTSYKNKKLTPMMILDIKKVLGGIYFNDDEYKKVLGEIEYNNYKLQR